MKKNSPLFLIIFFILYFLAWLFVFPFLLFIKNLKPFNKQRLGMGMPQGPFDLWIHAASVGEAKLALKVLSNLPENEYKKVLITTITSQGMEILSQGNIQKASLAYFPLDFVFLMPCWCLKRINPRKLLLLETEIWPGLLWACRKKSIPAVIGNARMSLKSFCRYLPLSKILNELSPETIIAVSSRDQDRFSAIFKNSQIKTMANIKFDLMENQSSVPYIHNPLSSFIKPGQPFIVLGSIRREEEIKIQRLIRKINQENPKTTIALFPRHMKRLVIWENFLNRHNIAWIHRSQIKNRPSSYDIILWDKFGELVYAYALAKSVYVGGTLVPCGGQNFLEPLSQGVVPCIGPFWDNFHWVGKDFLSTGLIHQINDEKELYSKLISPGSYSKEKIIERFNHFLSEQRNGTLQLISTIS